MDKLIPVQLKQLQIYAICAFCIWLSSCSVTRHIDDDQRLVARVSFEGVKDAKLREGLKQNLKFRLNKRVIGWYPFYLQAWNFGKDGRDTTRIRRFFSEKIGEKPSLLDSAALESSVKQLQLYLFNNGYFDTKVSYQVRTRRKKAFVTYSIDLNEPEYINSLIYKIYDRDVYRQLMKDTSACFIRPGRVLNTEDLSEERDRITANLRNAGFFYFSKDYVGFDVDTFRFEQKVDVAIEVKNPGLYQRHQVYRVDQVYVDVNYPYFLSGKDDSAYHEISSGLWLKKMGFKLDDDVVPRYIKIQPGALYREKDFISTYNQLSELQVFDGVNITILPDTAHRLLQVFITLKPSYEHDFTMEPQAITSDQSSAVQAINRRIWGLSSQIQYRNKNSFKGAELFDLRLGTSAEFQYNNRSFVYSNFEQSISASVTIPKINRHVLNAWPVRKVKPNQAWRNPRTGYNLTFSYENNLDFVQRTMLLSWSYSAAKGYNMLRLVPVEINFNQVRIKSDLLDRLGVGDRLLLSTLLNTNFIPSSRVEWVYNDNGMSRTGNYHFFRWNVLEWAGNLWYAGFRLAGTPRVNNKPYQVLNSDLYQYAKTDFDWRYYQNPNRDNRMAYRVRVGIAYPYGNSKVIPFDKRFFIGGANSLRGWRPRSIGPGEYTALNATQIDRSGEVVLEGSAEFRFNVIDNFLEGAFFADAGNIWNSRADTSLPGAEFRLDRFYRQLAINTGIGARFDFSFFVVRFDLGIQLRDPSYKLNKSWVWSDYNFLNRRMTLNFGIGYPF